MSIRNRSRVLIFCSRLPTIVQGGLDLRVRNQILATVSRGPTGVFALTGAGARISNDLEMWSSASDQSPTLGVSSLAILSKIMVEGREPYWNRFSSNTAIELLEAIRQFRPDVIVISRLELMPYIEIIASAGVKKVILDLDETCHDAQSSIGAIIENPAHTILYKRYSEALIAYEKRMVALVDEVWLCSDIELQKFRRNYSNLIPSFMIPNTINGEEYSKTNELRIPHRLIFTASFSYEPNLDGVRFILQELMPRLSNCSIDLVGSLMVDWVRNIDHPQVNIVGQVKSMTPYLSRASVAVIPLRAGGGTRLKALEAMASNLPVVSTAFGVEGLGLIHEENVLIAENPEDFADACRRIETDQELRSHIIRNAMAKVESDFSLNKLCKILSESFG